MPRSEPSDAVRVGHFLAQQAEELTRIWRLARAEARPEVFPGLLDDVVVRFFSLAGDLLARTAEPEDAWPRLAGLVRWPPPLAPGELAEEWAVLLDVLSATCESVNAPGDVASWLERAVKACASGTAALDGGRDSACPGLVIALVFSPLEPPQPRSERDERA